MFQETGNDVKNSDYGIIYQNSVRINVSILHVFSIFLPNLELYEFSYPFTHVKRHTESVKRAMPHASYTNTLALSSQHWL